MLKIDSHKFLILLAESEMTTAELQVKSGIGRNTISKIMNGYTNIRPQIIGKLAKSLGVSIEELITSEN